MTTSNRFGNGRSSFGRPAGRAKGGRAGGDGDSAEDSRPVKRVPPRRFAADGADPPVAPNPIVPVASASEDEVDGEFSRTSTERAKRAESGEDAFSRSSTDREARKTRGSSFGSGAKSSFRSGGGSSLSRSSSSDSSSAEFTRSSDSRVAGKPGKPAKPRRGGFASAPVVDEDGYTRSSSRYAATAKAVAAPITAVPSPAVSVPVPVGSSSTAPATGMTGKLGFIADVSDIFDADAFDTDDDDDEPFVAPSSNVPPPGSPQTVQPQKKTGPSLKARAVDLLSRREQSEQEMRRKLARHAEDPAEVEPVIASLKKEGWLSAERFTQSLVHRRASGRGMSRVVQELRQHGIDPDQIAEVKESLQATEVSRARDVWERRYGTPPEDANARAKQTRFLMSRGFSYDVIKQVLSGAGDVHDD